jgi:hypothetical protein
VLIGVDVKLKLGGRRVEEGSILRSYYYSNLTSLRFYIESYRSSLSISLS